MTNALLTAAGDYGVVPVTTDHVEKLSYDDGIYQAAGAGSYYLADGSSYRNAGTTAINPGTLADIATKTTYPPMIYSNTAIAGGTYRPYVQRDTDTPDLGYHYDPLDYCFGRADAPTNIVFTAGTAVAYFDLPQYGSLYYSYGLSLPNASSVTYLGTLASPCAQVRYSTVQEGNGNWNDVPVWSSMAVIGFIASLGTAAYDTTIASTVNARFTLFTGHPNQSGVGGAYTSDIMLRFTDCTLNSGRATCWAANLCFTNCLFLGTSIGIEDFRNVDDLELHNCTVREGHMFASHLGGSIWPVRMENCAFDNVDFTQLAGDAWNSNPTMAYYDYNAFVTNQTRLPLLGAHDVIVTNFNWQTSWLGNYYLPPSSLLINTGHGTADQWGLYHFTTQTNQVKETNSVVDVGYHYVATDANGQAIDIDGDGIPDYLEDSNGNGIFDAGDLGDWLVSLYNGLSRTNGLQVFTPLK